jgi:hypothetical protein
LATKSLGIAENRVFSRTASEKRQYFGPFRHVKKDTKASSILFVFGLFMISCGWVLPKMKKAGAIQAPTYQNSYHFSAESATLF